MADLFHVLMENNPTKILSLAFSLTGIIFGPMFLYSIIWFEKFGSDQRRFFINKMVSSICWSVVALIIFVQVPEIVFHFYLPFPDLYCQFYIVCKNAIVVQAILFLDAIVIFKYISIFWLKNPLSLKDDFWCLFINIWVVLIRFVVTNNQNHIFVTI